MQLPNYKLVIIHFLIALKGDEVTHNFFFFSNLFHLITELCYFKWNQYRRVACLLKVVGICEWTKLINIFLLYFIGRTANDNSATHIGIYNGLSQSRFIVISWRYRSNYSLLNASLKHRFRVVGFCSSFVSLIC